MRYSSRTCAKSRRIPPRQRLRDHPPPMGARSPRADGQRSVLWGGGGRRLSAALAAAVLPTLFEAWVAVEPAPARPRARAPALSRAALGAGSAGAAPRVLRRTCAQRWGGGAAVRGGLEAGAGAGGPDVAVVEAHAVEVADRRLGVLHLVVPASRASGA
jgi:hypothetical protein